MTTAATAYKTVASARNTTDFTTNQRKLAGDSNPGKQSWRSNCKIALTDPNRSLQNLIC